MALMCAVEIGGAQTARAAGAVGTGTPNSYTEAALDAALDGGGSVTFNCGGPATITISSSKTISGDTTIDGGGLVTISGGNSVPVFWVNFGIRFTLQNLTIADGYGGNGASGGIDNQQGIVTIANSTFSGNRGKGNGGGIGNFGGMLTVSNSTFSNNADPGQGGAIANAGGMLTVTNSTFAGNIAVGCYGVRGCRVGFGGAIINGWGNGSVGTATLVNCTFSGNSATGNGALGGEGAGGAIFNAGTLIMSNSIVANSSSGGNCAGTAAITNGGHNLDSDGTCGVGPGTDVLLDQAGLTDNGGSTQTIALLAGSLAINGGDPEVCAGPPVNGVDQRGYARPGAGHNNCSIGAFEFNAAPPANVCPGDCDSNGEVTIDEMLTLVKIALGEAQASMCPQGSPSGARVDIALIMQAVNNALRGCGGG